MAPGYDAPVARGISIQPPLPFVPGSEYAGVVQAVGEGVTHLQAGQRVACLSGTGGFAIHTLAPAALCMPLPDRQHAPAWLRRRSS